MFENSSPRTTEGDRLLVLRFSWRGHARLQRCRILLDLFHRRKQLLHLRRPESVSAILTRVMLQIQKPTNGQDVKR